MWSLLFNVHHCQLSRSTQMHNICHWSWAKGRERLMDEWTNSPLPFSVLSDHINSVALLFLPPLSLPPLLHSQLSSLLPQRFSLLVLLVITLNF